MQPQWGRGVDDVAAVKILVVDDSKVMRMIVKKSIRQAGFGTAETDDAGNASEAIEKIDSFRPDLVLCDWNMPGMTGLELLTNLRASGNVVKFGFITSEGSAETRQAAADAGALFLLAKPFTAEDLKTHLDVVLAA